jgi:transcription termination factor Rho
MELILDRRLAERRIYPAIDIGRSSTRREELLLDEAALKQVWVVRRMVQMISANSPSGSSEATERLIDRMGKTENNEEFLSTLKHEA